MTCRCAVGFFTIFPAYPSVFIQYISRFQSFIFNVFGRYFFEYFKSSTEIIFIFEKITIFVI
jgi:hypothetical protein